MIDYYPHLKEILDKLSDIYLWELHEYNFSDVVRDTIGDICRFNYEIKSGATRGVIILPDFNYVIKIPFTQDEDGYEFQNATFDDEGWNYCENEIHLYEHAIEWGVEEFLLPIKKIAEVNDYPIYVQSLAKVFTDVKQDNSTQKDLETISKSSNGICVCGNITWLMDILNKFGEDKFKQFAKFIQEFNINDDLHNHNIGYVYDFPVILDYAGYRE